MVAITLTGFINEGVIPRVEVLITDLPAEAITVTVYRISGGRTWRVRGAVNAYAVGGVSRLDYEAPFGTAATYRAEMFDVDGISLGFTPSESITLNVADTWFHNPFNPGGAVVAQFRGHALRDLARPATAGVFYPLGRSRGVVIGGVRTGLQGVNVSAATDTIEQANKMLALLGTEDSLSVPVVCVRIGANDRIRVPRTLFLAVLDQREQDVDYVYGGETIWWEMVGDEVDPPAVGLSSSAYTYADVEATYATYPVAEAGFLTYLDATRHYSLAGAAS